MRVLLALGSNLGARDANLEEALRLLELPTLRVTRRSPVYETAPQGYVEQDWFLNMVIEAETSLAAHALLSHCQWVEQSLHRERGVRNGPRTIDIDILFYGSEQLQDDRLAIPHPRYAGRRFVLQPLADLEPAFRDPVTHEGIQDLLKAVADQPVRLVHV